jgi:preprotein translocase subunit SecE
METTSKSSSGKSGSGTSGLEIYKSGQGKIARIGAYVLGGILVISGAVSLYRFINVPGREWVTGLPIIGHVSIFNTIAFGVALLGLLALHLVLNRPGTANALIDTETELKKVSWPSRREVKNATIVVSLVTLVMALLLFGFDRFLQWLFRLVY